MLMIGVWSVAGRPCITVIRKTVMFNMVYTGQSFMMEGREKYLFYRDAKCDFLSRLCRNQKDKSRGEKSLDIPLVSSQSYSAKMLIRTAGWM